mmetsp:Transcript_17823/g.53794  ORF Transcript_17823/g.53794 Transcript_17823/m.53794 type:complete len:162 (+) Transcript_17823:214-699(+)|eukprot:scaffold70581_cov31-Tisochrysis_lutea.AAC.1
MALTHSVCRVPALLRILRRGMASDIDSALANALRQATRRIQQADPSATVMTTTESPNVDRGDGWDTSAAPGVRTQGEKMLLRFTCTHDPCDASGEDRVTIKTISKNSYENGVSQPELPPSRSTRNAQDAKWPDEPYARLLLAFLPTPRPAHYRCSGREMPL